jgi:hypothetical protein
LRALTTEGADENNDQQLSTIELARSLARQVPARTHDLQHPNIAHDNPDTAITLPSVPLAKSVVDQ